MVCVVKWYERGMLESVWIRADCQIFISFKNIRTQLFRAHSELRLPKNLLTSWVVEIESFSYNEREKLDHPLDITKACCELVNRSKKSNNHDLFLFTLLHKSLHQYYRITSSIISRVRIHPQRPASLSWRRPSNNKPHRHIHA